MGMECCGRQEECCGNNCESNKTNCCGARNVLTKEEKLAQLREYKEALEQEIKGITQKMKELEQN